MNEKSSFPLLQENYFQVVVIEHGNFLIKELKIPLLCVLHLLDDQTSDMLLQ